MERDLHVFEGVQWRGPNRKVTFGIAADVQGGSVAFAGAAQAGRVIQLLDYG
jgi:hypothetical protein